LIGLILLVELVLVLASWRLAPGAAMLASTPPVENTQAIGLLMYTRYVYLFQGAGLILLVAMIGAIVLTLRSREGVRRQSIARQVARRREEAVAVVQVKSGEGVTLGQGKLG
jgi:NADH-quinone oxidoreductase subunit J